MQALDEMPLTSFGQTCATLRPPSTRECSRFPVPEDVPRPRSSNAVSLQCLQPGLKSTPPTLPAASADGSHSRATTPVPGPPPAEEPAAVPEPPAAAEQPAAAKGKGSSTLGNDVIDCKSACFTHTHTVVGLLRTTCSSSNHSLYHVGPNRKSIAIREAQLEQWGVSAVPDTC
jgi:hypothetical protein